MTFVFGRESDIRTMFRPGVNVLDFTRYLDNHPTTRSCDPPGSSILCGAGLSGMQQLEYLWVSIGISCRLCFREIRREDRGKDSGNRDLDSVEC